MLAVAVSLGLAQSVAAQDAPRAAAADDVGGRDEEREHVVRVAGAPTFPGRGELWARRVTRALERARASVVTPAAYEWDRRGLASWRLEALAEVEASLGAARRAQADLEEDAALRALAEASRRATELLDVPGAAAWLAEVEVVTAIVAAQRGDTSLAEASLRRALALAPDRALQEGEAPPELVARSRELQREEVRRARVEVRVVGTAAEPDAQAEVYVDDRLYGPLPRELELPSGLHVLRIEARGHAPYARLVDLAPGSRAPIVVAPTPGLAMRDAGALDEAIRAGDPLHVREALAAIVAHGGVDRAVWMVFVGVGPLDRALAVQCRARGCDTPLALDDASLVTVDASAPPLASFHPLDRATLGLARRWLDEVPVEVPPPEPSIVESWWFWTALGVAAVGAGVGLGLALQPSGDAPLVLRIDPCTGCAE